MSIASNRERVMERIAAAAQRAGREPDAIRLVAVVKNRSLEEIRELHAAGQRLMAFNRVQEAQQKIPGLPADIEWHMIGHIQTNKAKLVSRLFSMAHSVDSVRVAAALARAHETAPAAGRPYDILLEVNISGEESKQGRAPGGAEAALRDILLFPALRVRGLMTMAPFVENPEQTRPIFRGLRELRDRLRESLLAAPPDGFDPACALLDHLSMGMTNDFEVAVEEGATLVRVGTALFESGT